MLILDLDETLIYDSEEMSYRQADFRVGPFFIYQRPFLDSFLRSVSHVQEIAVWSSASKGFFNGIAQHLLPMVGRWRFICSSSRCIHRLNPDSYQVD
ncbi:MAG: NIF family HAD-type phosphatase [Pirellulaceae bacterium]|jgi:RNA polymerase II subunit A small phosphatase-like protein